MDGIRDVNIQLSRSTGCINAYQNMAAVHVRTLCTLTTGMAVACMLSSFVLPPCAISAVHLRLRHDDDQQYLYEYGSQNVDNERVIHIYRHIQYTWYTFGYNRYITRTHTYIVKHTSTQRPPCHSDNPWTVILDEQIQRIQYNTLVHL